MPEWTLDRQRASIILKLCFICLNFRRCRAELSGSERSVSQ